MPPPFAASGLNNILIMSGFIFVAIVFGCGLLLFGEKMTRGAGGCIREWCCEKFEEEPEKRTERILEEAKRIAKPATGMEWHNIADFVPDGTDMSLTDPDFVKAAANKRLAAAIQKKTDGDVAFFTRKEYKALKVEEHLTTKHFIKAGFAFYRPVLHPFLRRGLNAFGSGGLAGSFDTWREKAKSRVLGTYPDNDDDDIEKEEDLALKKEDIALDVASASAGLPLELADSGAGVATATPEAAEKAAPAAGSGKVRMPFKTRGFLAAAKAAAERPPDTPAQDAVMQASCQSEGMEHSEPGLLAASNESKAEPPSTRPRATSELDLVSKPRAVARLFDSPDNGHGETKGHGETNGNGVAHENGSQSYRVEPEDDDAPQASRTMSFRPASPGRARSMTAVPEGIAPLAAQRSQHIQQMKEMSAQMAKSIDKKRVSEQIKSRSPRKLPSREFVFEVAGPLGIGLVDGADGAVRIEDVDPQLPGGVKGVQNGSLLLEVNGINLDGMGAVVAKALVSAAARPVRLRIAPPGTSG